MDAIAFRPKKNIDTQEIWLREKERGGKINTCCQSWFYFKKERNIKIADNFFFLILKSFHWHACFIFKNLTIYSQSRNLINVINEYIKIELLIKRSYLICIYRLNHIQFLSFTWNDSHIIMFAKMNAVKLFKGTPFYYLTIIHKRQNNTKG